MASQQGEQLLACQGACPSLLTAPVLIGVLFYAYKAILGRHMLPLDIAVFVIAVVAGQMVGYAVMTRRRLGGTMRQSLSVLLVAMVTAFSLLTYFPRRCFLFLDPPTGQYGILEEQRP